MLSRSAPQIRVNWARLRLIDRSCDFVREGGSATTATEANRLPPSAFAISSEVCNDFDKVAENKVGWTRVQEIE